MIQGAIFDADGTLLDSMTIWEDAGAKYLKGLGISAEPRLGKILYPMTLEEGAAYLKKQYCLSEPAESIIQGILLTVNKFYMYEVQTKPYVQNFLEELYRRNIPMAIATTGDKEQLETAFERLGIISYFKRIFTCTELNTSKNEAYIYREAAEYMSTDVKSTFVFEDMLHAVKAASGGGFKTVAVEDAASKNDKAQIKKSADYYMSDFSDFEGFWSFASRE